MRWKDSQRVIGLMVDESAALTGEARADAETALRDIAELIAVKHYLPGVEHIDTGGGVVNLLWTVSAPEGPEPVVTVVPEESAYLYATRTDYEDENEPVLGINLYSAS